MRFPFTRPQPVASQDAVQHLMREAGAYRSLADVRRADARDAPTATGRARLLGRARDADRTARQLGREARRR